MPDPNAAGSLRNSLWWVIQSVTGARGGPPGFHVTMATSKPQGSVAGPFTSQANAQKWIVGHENQGLPPVPNPVSAVGGWLSSIGGYIGSGIEAGFVSFFKDLWTVLVGPLEILLGVLIAMWVLVIYFKDDIMQLARMAGTMAVMAG